jgi:DNA-binding response OmpR family regulator
MGAQQDLDAAIDLIREKSKSMPTALIIEDNHDLCWHLQEVLTPLAQCEFAHRGDAGVEQALEIVPDIVICDVILPGLNGFEVTRRIKEDTRTSHVPVIMLTAKADHESRLRGLQALADAYLTKPFNDVELAQRVETLLSIREILRQRFADEWQRKAMGQFPAEMDARDQRFLKRVQEVMATHYSDPDFTMQEFASLVAMSERQLQRKLKALTNSSPREFLRRFRLEKSVELLRAGDSAGNVGFAVGFSSQSYFTSCFKAQYGVPPASWVKGHRADVD